jgi:glutathione-specific gamma-glutamylcyclotransferase
MSTTPHFVFAYGSLMWRPEIPHTVAFRARLDGYHRSLCHYSNHYRGTDEKPGLVFGLDLGGACEGLAYEIAASDWPEAYAILHAREMSRHTYEEIWCPVNVAEKNETVQALAYVMNRNHTLYAGALPLADIVRLVRQGEGIMGRCIDYVQSTDAKLKELGIIDPYVAEIAASLAL